MAGTPPPARSRRERLEALLASGQASVERARSRSLVVDTVVSVVQRERPVGVGILAGSLAFRLFALVVPLIYVLVAGLGVAGAAGERSRFGNRDNLGALVVDSVATAARTSERGHWLALLAGGLATLLAANGVVEVLRWVHVLAWRVPRIQARRRRPLVPLGLVAGIVILAASSTFAHRARADAEGLASELTVILVSAGAQVVLLALLWLALSLVLPRAAGVPWTALVPGSCLFAAGFQGFSLALTLYFAPRAARASALYGSLGVALTLLVSLFLFARLAVAAAELNAYLWERRHAQFTPKG